MTSKPALSAPGWGFCTDSARNIHPASLLPEPEPPPTHRVALPWVPAPTIYKALDTSPQLQLTPLERGTITALLSRVKSDPAQSLGPELPPPGEGHTLSFKEWTCSPPLGLLCSKRIHTPLLPQGQANPREAISRGPEAPQSPPAVTRAHMLRAREDKPLTCVVDKGGRVLPEDVSEQKGSYFGPCSGS